jgi:THO complex subunit 3
LQFSPDGNILAISNIKDELSFFDFRMWKMIKQMKFKNEVNDFTWDKTGNGFFVADNSGSITLFNGQTLNSQPITSLDFHYSPCVSLSVDPHNKYLVSGGSDSLIGIWDMEELLVQKTISNNDYKVVTLSTSFDGEYIAGIFEDDINKRHYMEVYDIESSTTVYSSSTKDVKNSIAWHPKKLIVAYGGEDRGEGIIHLLHPTG